MSTDKTEFQVPSDPVEERVAQARGVLGADAKLTWSVHRVDAQTRAEEHVATIYEASPAFDERDFAAVHGPGRYRRRLRIEGRRGNLADEQFTIAPPPPPRPSPDQPAALPPWANLPPWMLQPPAPPPPPAKDERAFELMLTMLQSSQQQLTTFMTSLAQRPVSPLAETLQLMEFLDRRRKEAPPADDAALVDLVKPFADALAGQMTQPAAPPAQAPAAPAAAAKPNQADQVRRWLGLAGELLAAGAASLVEGEEVADVAEQYAQVIADTAARAIPGARAWMQAWPAGALGAALIQARPELKPHEAFIGEVEKCLRAMVAETKGGADAAHPER